MSVDSLPRICLLPELDLIDFWQVGFKTWTFFVKKNTEYEVCPRCATICKSVYDHREVTIKDAPIRAYRVSIKIRKRRFHCKSCSKVFMEPVSGISKGSKFTQRFKSHVLWACDKFSSLKDVKKYLGCSFGFIYNALYEQLELNSRKHVYPWPPIIGLDEHSFAKNKKYGYTEFVTMVVDHKNKRTIELVKGKSKHDLLDGTAHFEGATNVKWVTMDLCSAFKSYAREKFPAARIVADKFHVVRLLDNHINKYRKIITGDKRKNPLRKLLLKDQTDLDFGTRSIIRKWLKEHPVLLAIYTFKQALHKLYRTKGYGKAKAALLKMIDAMGFTGIPELLSLRRTLMKWKAEILNYFIKRITNARVEGFNNKAKLIKRRAYGYRSFKNYRLRILNDCWKRR